MATVRYFPHMQGFTKTESESLEAATVADVLAHVRKAYGAPAAKAAKSSLIVVNDTSIELTGRNTTPLSSDDIVAFLPLCGGG